MSELALKIIEQAIKENPSFVDLGNCGLTAIPPEIVRLPDSVTHINFGTYYFFLNNKWEESLNEDNENDFAENTSSFDLLGRLENLQKLDLYNCSINRDGASALSDLSHLIYLNIGYNEIGNAGAESISRLSQLTSLYISSNKIDNAGAESISRLSQLTSLDIRYNQIGDAGAESISRLNQLTSLDIGSNQIGHAGAESISRLSQLTSLNIGSNQIGHAGAESISRLSQLTSLDIRYNQIGHAGAESISRLSQLTSLDISDNQISNAGAESISRLSQLTYLDISSNKIGNAGAESISRLSQLTSLYISSNKIGHAGAESISRLSQLTSLDIGYNQIGNAGAESISRLSQLTSLDIRSNKIDNAGAESISRLSQLTYLDIRYNQIGNAGAESISRLSQLTSLYISDNQIGDAGAESISRLSQLTSLYIRSNTVSYALPLKNLRKLTSLDITDNPLRDVPETIYAQYNCINNLRIWWQETEDKTKVKPNKIVKLQVLGNGGAGKSSVIEALKKGICTEEFPSTHGIIIEPVSYMLNGEETGFQAWDFGGQEIYHGTHRLFIASQALHLLVADELSEQQAITHKKVPDRQNPEELVLHQPLQHYIDLSKRQSPKSIRVVVKNKADMPPIHDIDLPGIARENELPFYAVSAKQGMGITVLREALAGKRHDVLHYGMPMPVSWLSMRQYFIDNIIAPAIDRRRLVSMEKFNELCRRFEVSDISIEPLLDFLHYTGIIYKNKEFLNDVIIADQKWALEAVYKPLDRGSDFYKALRNDLMGRVQVKELFRAFGHEYEPQHKWLFLHFMRSCGLCFPFHQVDGKKEDEESYYVFPEFLPEEETPAVKAGWQTAREVKTFSCTPEFLDHYRIQNFIVEFGNKTAIGHIWRNGILVLGDKGMFRVEVVNNKTLRISIEAQATDDYLRHIISFLDRNRNPYEKAPWISNDGAVTDVNSLPYRSYDINIIGNKRDTESDSSSGFKDKLPNVEQPSPKRLVISFTSENMKDLKDVVRSLRNYQQNGSIQVLYDAQVLDGRSYWDNQIQEMFMKAEGYLLLVSMEYQDFIEHPYIWDIEIPIIEQRNREERVFAFCMAVAPVVLNDLLKKFTVFKNGRQCLPESGHTRAAYLIEFAQQVIEGKFLKQDEFK